VVDFSDRAPVYAWVVTGVCFWMATLAWGTVFYGNTFFIPALQQAHGWSAATVSSAIALFFWLAIPVTLIFGWIADTFGTRLAVAYSGIAVGGGVAMMGELSEPWQLYLAYALIATGYPLMATPAISASLVPWFGPKMGLPLSLALTGASFGGAVSVPLMVSVSADFGFNAVTRWVGLLVAGSVTPLALLVLRRPNQAQRPPSVANETSFTPRQALATGLFWRIAIAGGLGLGAQVGYLSHQLAIGSDVVSIDHAAYAVSLGVACGAVGRLATGYLSVRVPVKWLTAWTYAMQGVGIGLLAYASAPLDLYTGAMVAGFVIGNITMLPPLLLREAFGPAAYGRLYGFANIVFYACAGLGSAYAGVIRNLTDSYTLALLTFVLVDAAAVLIVVTMPRTKAENT